MELPSQMILFAHVVQAGSFSSTARALDQTPSAVSKQIGHLEERVGVRLLNRTKHGLSPTEEGRKFYERCVDIADRISDAEKFADSLDDHPKGRLNIVSTVAFGKSQLLPVMPDFMSRYPDVAVSLELTDRKLDLAEQNIDLAIRFTEQVDNNSDIARKLSENRRVICASPQYLKTFGTPEKAADLKHHNCLRITTVDGWNDWNLAKAESGGPSAFSGNFECNSADGIYHAALAGIGIARLSTYLISEDLRTGRLMQLFPEYEDVSSNILAIYPDRRNLSSKVRVLVDYLVSEFGRNPPWEQQQ